MRPNYVGIEAAPGYQNIGCILHGGLTAIGWPQTGGVGREGGKATCEKTSRKGKVAIVQEEGGKPDAMEVDGEEKVDERVTEGQSHILGGSRRWPGAPIEDKYGCKQFQTCRRTPFFVVELRASLGGC
jgi:hypothetical protein